MLDARITIMQKFLPLQAIARYFPGFLSLVFLPGLLAAAPLIQDAGADGLVVMEVENNDGNTPQGTNTWAEVFSPTGFSGTSAHQAQPDFTSTISSGFATTSPRLDYQVNFNRTGTHYVWLLGRGDTSASNSVFTGLDGIEDTLTNQVLHFNAGTGWEWSSLRTTLLMATIEVPTIGLHTFNIWMRESGTYVDRILLTSNAAYVPTGLEPETPRSGNLFADNFNDGNVFGWSVVDNCTKGTSNWILVNNTFMQSGNCRGFSTGGVAIGTHAFSTTALPAKVDIQLRLRSQDTALDGTTTNDGSIWNYGTIGVLFGYQDANNHYRFELDGIKGHRKLWRVQGGNYTELSTSPQSFLRDQWFGLRIVSSNGVILVFIDGQQVMAVEDASFSSGPMALFCARNSSCSYDDIVVVNAPIAPMIGLNLPDGSTPVHTSSEYFVDADGILDVAAMTTESTDVGGVEFLVDEGTPGEVSQIDLSAPYATQFTGLATGEHAVSAYLLDGAGTRFIALDATVNFPQIGINGIHLYAIGDSITAGLFDDIPSDDVSADGRNTAAGYEPILNDYLLTSNGVPITVLNDGNAGEESWEGSARIIQVLSGSPEAMAYLAFYGANDSGGSTPTPSGLGLSPGAAGYAGSFKDNIQQIIDVVTSAGKGIFLAKAPPYLANSTRDALVLQYNQVIDELIAANGLGYAPADFHTWFTANPSEFSADGIHPAGIGYQSMARIWCESLNLQMGLWCLDDDRDGLLNSTEAVLGTNPALADSDGDGLVDGNGGIVPVTSLPGGVDFDGDGFVDGEQMLGTDPLLVDSDGDRLSDGQEVASGADPLDPASWPNLADRDVAPLGAPDGQVNAGDYLIILRIALGQLTATPLELAHGDLYPPGAPDGQINIQDLLLMQLP